MSDMDLAADLLAAERAAHATDLPQYADLLRRAAGRLGELEERVATLEAAQPYNQEPYALGRQEGALAAGQELQLFRDAVNDRNNELEDRDARIAALEAAAGRLVATIHAPPGWGGHDYRDALAALRALLPGGGADGH